MLYKRKQLEIAIRSYEETNNRRIPDYYGCHVKNITIDHEHNVCADITELRDERDIVHSGCFYPLKALIKHIK